MSEPIATNTLGADAQAIVADNDAVVAEETPENVTRGTDITESDADGEVATEEAEEVDYEAIMRSDLVSLKSKFPELHGLRDISELPGALRYAALRDLGLTAEEAYMAASAPRVRRDNRSHLSTAVSRGAGAPGGSMTHAELLAARQLFGGMSDAEIQSLYKRVKN